MQKQMCLTPLESPKLGCKYSCGLYKADWARKQPDTSASQLRHRWPMVSRRLPTQRFAQLDEVGILRSRWPRVLPSVRGPVRSQTSFPEG